MVGFIINNLSTIFVSLLLLGIVVLIIKSMRKDKKSGKSCSCGDGCGGCSASGICHSGKKQ